MTASSFLISVFQSLLLTFFIGFMLSVSEAQVRSSNNYQLQSDSINFAGGLSTSSNYSLESTVGEIATGESTSTSYALKAGYQQMQGSYISLSVPLNATLTPAISGLTGGTANGSTSVVVLTDSQSGYELSIQASQSPAMQKGVDTIADYVPIANPNPDYFFTTSATQAHFGFSPDGPDVTDRFLNNGSACNISTTQTPLACWDGLSTTPKQIALGTANQPSGATTTIHFRVEVGANTLVLAGEYVATTTLTALTL